jgi:succinyl-diaminopimelate desuccinylase
MFDPKQLHANIEARGDQLVAVLCDLLKFETVSGTNDPESIERFEKQTRKCLDYLADFAERNDIVHREFPAGVAVLEWGAGDEAIGFATHTDVVPAVGHWHHKPFGHEIVDGKIYGRGTQDNKGPLACGLIALLAIRDLKQPARRKIRLIMGTREEPGDWTDIAGYLKAEPAPLNTIVPDASFPIINGEKGMATVKLTLETGRAPEREDELRLDLLRAGERFNVVPDRAHVRLSGPRGRRAALLDALKEEYEAYEKSRPMALQDPITAQDDPDDPERFRVDLTFLGKSAHGSRPEEGHNAAVDALGYLVRLAFPKSAATDFIGWAYLAGKDTVGEYMGVDAWHDFIGLTTASLNIFRLDDRAVEAQVNVRFPLGLTGDDLFERTRKRLEKTIPVAGHRPKVEPDGIVHEPLFTDPEQYPEFFEAVRTAYEAVAGRKPKLKAVGGTTYAKAFPRAVTFGPIDEEAGERDMAHKSDEYVTRDVMIRNAKIYAHALAALCLE